MALNPIDFHCMGKKEGIYQNVAFGERKLSCTGLEQHMSKKVSK